MEHPCSLKRAGCPFRAAFGCGRLIAPPKRAYVRAYEHRLTCRSTGADGSYDKGLTRSQEGRRQRPRRKASSDVVVQSSPWSSSEPAGSRLEWLQGAKQQPSEALLSGFLAPARVPLPRLPVLLTLLEGRPDLGACLRSAGLPAVAAAVLHSDMLLRLLPGGRLHEQLAAWIEAAAADLPPAELSSAARLVAAWPPPTAAAALAPAAAALAAAASSRALKLVEPKAPKDRRGRGGSRSRAAAAAEAETAAATEGSGREREEEQAAMHIAKALELLHPWLTWAVSGSGAGSSRAAAGMGARAEAAAAAVAEGGSWDVEGLPGYPGELGMEGEEGWSEAEAAAAAEDLAGARAAVEALVRRVGGGGGDDGGGVAAAVMDPAVVHAVVSAAAVYDVEVPCDLARAAASLVCTASTSAASAAPADAGYDADDTDIPQTCDAAAKLAVELIAQAVAATAATLEEEETATSGVDSTGGGALSADEVRGLVTSRLGAALGEAQHVAFLRALLSRMQEVRQRLQPVERTRGRKDPLPLRKEQKRLPFAGLVEGLGSSAAGLGATALALAMGCTAEAIAVHGNAVVPDVRDAAVEAIVRQLNAGELLASSRELRRQDSNSGGGLTADDICWLAAAALRLRRTLANFTGGVATTPGDGALSAVLAAVISAPLQGASMDALVAVVAAAAPMDFGASTADSTAEMVFAGDGVEDRQEGLADGAEGGASSPPPQVSDVPVKLLDVLLGQLAATAKAQATAKATAKAAAQAPDSSSIDHQQHRQPPTMQFTHDQATAILAAATAAAEAATASVASTCTATPSAEASTPHRAIALQAAGTVACCALTRTVRHLDAAAAIRLLQLVVRSHRARVLRPYWPLLWALHERLRVLGAALDPAASLEVLRCCNALQWRPTVLLRELVLPLLRWLQAGAAADAGLANPAALALLPEDALERRQHGGSEDGADDDGVWRQGWSRPRPGCGNGPRAWTSAELRESLVLLASLGFGGPLGATLVKLGVGSLLRTRGSVAGSSSRNGRSGSQMTGALAPEDLVSLLWVCVTMQYRGASLLRQLLQRLLQVPAPQVSVSVASRAVWAAARLGAVSERLVRWALVSCQGAGKLASAPPRSLALLCWGLAKLGTKPPQGFMVAVTAATVGHLTRFKPHELATTLFALATWRYRLGAAAAAVHVIRHVVATRSRYDAPALCTAVWALQQLTAADKAIPSAAIASDASAGVTDASVAAAGGDGGGGGDGTAVGAVAVPLDAAALAAIEDRLLDIFPSVSRLRRMELGIADHHLLRYLSACASASAAAPAPQRYRPERLLRIYSATLRSRLHRLARSGRAADDAAAHKRSRLLWSVARVMAMYDMREPALLSALESTVINSQATLRPGHLAGLLASMASLGHYPSRWAPRGLLRRVGLALRRANVTEAGLILEAMAAWREQLSATAAETKAKAKAEADATAPLAAAAAASRPTGLEERTMEEWNVEEDEGGEGKEDGVAEQGNGQAAAVEGVEAAAATAAPRTPWIREVNPQRLDLLRRVALARLETLCVPPPPPPPLSPTAADSHPSATASTAASAAPPPPAAAAAATAAVSISLDDGLRLLAALAKLRWKLSLPLETVLVRAVSELPVERRLELKELTLLLWVLASLRHDAPELVDGLQSALLGEAPQRSLAAELALFEAGAPAGRDATAPAAAPAAPAGSPAGGAAGAGSQTLQAAAHDPAPAAAEAAEAEAPASGASAPAPLPAATQATEQPGASTAEVGIPGTETSGSSSSSSTIVITSSSSDSVAEAAPSIAPVAAATGNSQDEVMEAASDGGSSPTSASLLAGPTAAGIPPTTSPTSDNAGSTSSSTNSSTNSSTSGLLSRPIKPPQAADSAAAAVPFDPAAATAAAAAAVNQRLEQQLDGPMGRGVLPSEPWEPVDVFKALWACAKMNRHPGPQILAAAERSWMSHTGAAATEATEAADASPPPLPLPPLHAVTGLLWALSVFRHHNGSFAQRLAAQLAARLQQARENSSSGDGGLAVQRAFEKQAVQVAACLLAAQADRAESPLNATLSPELRARAVAAWRSRLMQRATRPPGRYQTDILNVLRKMGLTAAINVATPDGCAVVDIAVALMAGPQPQGGSRPMGQQPRLLALELIGPHNSASNSPRITGEAVIKYRLLQARGYLVVPLPCYEWDRINHQDVWTKMVYLQNKIERRTVAVGASSAISGSRSGSGNSGGAAAQVPPPVPPAAAASVLDSRALVNARAGS